MFRLTLLWTLLVAMAMADTLTAEDAYDRCCLEKNRLALIDKDGMRFYAVGPEQILHLGSTVKQTPKGWHLVRSDRLFGLTLYQGPHDAWPLDFRTMERIGEHTNRLRVMNSEGVRRAVFVHHQEGFWPARADTTLSSGEIVCAPCYSVMGLGFQDGFIESDLITHFLTFLGNDFGWGDLGFRLQKGALRLDRVDPFFDNNPFLPGDELIAIDGKNLDFPSDAHRHILMLTPGEKAMVSISRSGKTHDFVVRVGKRLGGGRFADTFLERYGWQLDSNLRVQAVDEQLELHGQALRVGDQLKQIDVYPVVTAEDVTRVLSTYDRPSRLLFSRDGFDFFVRTGTSQGDLR